MKKKFIALLLAAATVCSIAGCGKGEESADEAGTIVIDESSTESTEGSEEETISLRRKNELSVVSDDPDTVVSAFWTSMNNAEYNFFDDETYEYSWLGVGSSVDYSSIQQPSIALIAKEVVDDNGYTSVDGPTYIGDDNNDEFYYLVFDNTYYLEVVYNAEEQGAYAIFDGADLPDGVEQVTTKYKDKETYLERREQEEAKWEEKREAELEKINEERAAAAATQEEDVAIGSPEITGPSYGFEYEDFDKLLDEGLHLPALHALKVKLSNYLTENGYDPYQAGTVNYVEGTFTEDGDTQSFEIIISNFPELKLKAVYTFEGQNLHYEAVGSASSTEGGSNG